MSFRIEKKILVNKFNLFDLKKKFFSLGATTLFKSRKVQSLYLDNVCRQMYVDSIEGLTPRKKIRVRNYPEASNNLYQLETKISSIEGRYKSTKQISKEYFQNICMNGYFDKKYGLCKPLLNVIYEREYLKIDDIRITIDTNIFYNIQNNLLKKKDLNVIVELKASKNKDIDDLFEQFPFQEIRFSKYCNGIEIFNKN